MSQDFADFLIEKVKTIKDKAPADNRKGKLTEILDELKKLLAVPETFSQELMDDLSDSLTTLDDILQYGLAQTEKREKGKCTTLTNICSPIKSTSVSKSLRKLENQLQNIAKKITNQRASGSDQPTAPEETSKEGDGRPYEWTTSFIDESRIFGWDKDVKDIIDPLIECKTFCAVGIVGMHGSGKTALAQKVFTHETIKDNFPLKLWICVSPSCTREELIYRMLDNLGCEQDDIERIIQKKRPNIDIGDLLFLLYLELLDNKYLIVFDDVWDTDDWYRNLTSEPPAEGEWNDRLAYGLPKGNGSAVIVTSRREDDARMMVDTGYIYHPKPLNDDEGWLLFLRAYNEAKEPSDSDSDSEDIEAKEPSDSDSKDIEAKEPSDSKVSEVKGPNDKKDIDIWAEMKTPIVKKCGGHPLALIVAGQRLACEKKVE